MVRRFPRQVAEERLEKIIVMAARAGKNVVWLSQDVFTIRDWRVHARHRARAAGGVYVVDELL